MRDWLTRINQVLMVCETSDDRQTSLERCVINLIHEVPIPPPGKLEVAIHIEGLTLHCSRPPVNSFSVLKNVHAI